MSIDAFRNQIEARIRCSIERMGEKSDLRNACEYALTSGGKRFRPILVLMIAEALGGRLDVFPAALSVEYFHTASLIADDLPCMDDDDIRRCVPTLHKVYGETVAILASYTLIAAGYEGIYENGKTMKLDPRFQSCADEISMRCLEAATRCAGIRGATGGQFLDLYPPALSLEMVEKIMYQKTVTLFEIAFVFGWLFGGGSIDKLEAVQKCSYHLGMAFQIADDLTDDRQDAAQPGSINITSICGKEKAYRMFEGEMHSFTAYLKELGLWTEAFREVVDWLWRLAPEPNRV